MSARTENRRALQSTEKDTPINTNTSFGTGGTLNRQQFDQFFQEVQDVPQILNRVRAVDVPLGEEHQIDAIGVGERIIRSATEGQSGDEVGVSDRKVDIDMVELELPFSISRRVLEDTIEGGNTADVIMDLFGSQFAVDSEDLGFIGGDPVGDLTGDDATFAGINDGWLQQSLNENRDVYDHASADIDESAFSALINELDPKYQRNGQELAFITSWRQKQAYKEYLTERDTAAGDAMLMTGDEPTPYGHEIITPVGMPDDYVMFCNPQNLIWAVLRDVDLQVTAEGSRVVLERLAAIGNFTARTDYVIEDPEGIVVAENVASPA